MKTGLPASKSAQAYAMVKEQILGGGYAPGHRLVLARIASEIGCSVVPVREAIRRLEAEGLVRFEHNVGAAVTAIDPVQYLFTMQTLSIVEGAATALAVPFIGPSDLLHARRLNRTMQACLSDLDPLRFTELNRQFHGILFARCPNPHILELVERGWDRLRTLRSSTFSYIPDRTHASVAEHDELLNLIESGAGPDAVEHAARAHRSATLNAYLTHSSTTEDSAIHGSATSDKDVSHDRALHS